MKAETAMEAARGMHQCVGRKPGVSRKPRKERKVMKMAMARRWPEKMSLARLLFDRLVVTIAVSACEFIIEDCNSEFSKDLVCISFLLKKNVYVFG